MHFNLSAYNDLALLLIRLVVAAIFIDSGRRNLVDPTARAQSIEMSKAFTIFLGIIEIAGGLGLIFGVLIQLAAAGLILIMLGAIQKKIFVWKTGFWGEKGIGWHYELMLIVMNLIILTSADGKHILF